MIGLTDTTHTLELITATGADVDYHATWADTTAAAHTPGSSQGSITTATTTTIVAAPGASTYRGIRTLTVANKDTTPQTVTVQKDISGTNYILMKCGLYPGESLVYSADTGFLVLDAGGRTKTAYNNLLGDNGNVYCLHKLMTGADASAYHYCWSKDSGFSIGAWSPGSPGVNGRNTDGTTSNDYGCIPLANAASGYKKFLRQFNGSSSVAQPYWLYDVLWVNTGLAPATTTAQAITMGSALPARDERGGTNGYGCMIGLLVTTATTNAAAVSNSTVSYTNQGGTAGRTATLSATAGFQIPATAVAGTIVWFTLQAGDIGVQSIQSITLGTSLAPSGSPTISLLIARPLCGLMLPTANDPRSNDIPEPGIRLYDGACILGGYTAVGTTAPTFAGTVTTVDK